MTMAPLSQLAEASSKVEVRFGTTQPQRRATVFFRIILAIPQFFVLYFVGIGAFFVGIVGWFAALFTGRLPEPIAKFLLGYVRWVTRVYAYAYLMVDAYPPFSLDPDPTYPVDVAVTTGRLNRAAVLFRFILVIPAQLLSALISIGMEVFGLITWIATLVSGKMPDAFFGATAAVVRFQARTNAYYLMLTSYYPSDLFGDRDTLGIKFESPVSGTFDTPPTRPNPNGGYSQTAAWSAAPQGAYAHLPPPPPIGSYPPPAPGTVVPQSAPTGPHPPPPPLPPMVPPSDGLAGIPDSFGVPKDVPTDASNQAPATVPHPLPEVVLPPPPWSRCPRRPRRTAHCPHHRRERCLRRPRRTAHCPHHHWAHCPHHRRERSEPSRPGVSHPVGPWCSPRVHGGSPWCSS